MMIVGDSFSDGPIQGRRIRASFASYMPENERFAAIESAACCNG
jgi:hypothetical protein